MLRLMLVLGAVVSLAPAVAGGEPGGSVAGDGAYVEVRGTLHVENGRGSYVRVEGQSRKPMRFHLIVPEDKVLVRRLQELEGRRVVVSGSLGQVGEGENTYYLPPHTLYITHIKNPAPAPGTH